MCSSAARARTNLQADEARMIRPAERLLVQIQTLIEERLRILIAALTHAQRTEVRHRRRPDRRSGVLEIGHAAGAEEQCLRLVEVPAGRAHSSCRLASRRAPAGGSIEGSARSARRRRARAPRTSPTI